MVNYQELRNGLVVTAFLKAKPHQGEAIAGILRKFIPQAQSNPGVQAFLVHTSKDKPSELFFYEVFEDEDAFEAHRKTPHFKELIAREALPKVAKRELSPYTLI